MSKTTNKYSPEVRKRAVRMVLDNPEQHESRWSAILSMFSKIGCAPQTLNEWVKQVGVDDDDRQDGLSNEEREELRHLRREVKQLRQERDILSKGCPLMAPLVRAQWATPGLHNTT